MPYTDFTLDSLLTKFNIGTEIAVLFPDLAPVTPPHDLKITLANSMDLALLSEKARSEYIVAPLLMAVRLMLNKQVSIYSGQRLDVDPAAGLYGECDFLLTMTKPLPFIKAPIVSVIEAKKNDIDLGLGQCAAQMLGSVRFNQRTSPELDTAYGCVTTGETWQFLRLQKEMVSLDQNRYYLKNELGLILAAFLTALSPYLPESS